MVFITAAVLALPLFPLSWAVPVPQNQPNKRQDAAAGQGTTWTIADKYEGQKFFDDWDFFKDTDPTKGFVAYQEQSAASDQKLAVVDENGVVTLSVDDKSKPPEGTTVSDENPFNRKAVRISTKKKYNGGLFVANISMMPEGCSTWPAYWMTAEQNWPNQGELDVLEGVNDQSPNKITAHTGSGCSLQGQTCENQPGCGVEDSTPSSFGPEFNKAGGGILVHRWTSSKIEVWHFKHDDAPQDIANGAPNPDSWGQAQFVLGGEECDIKNHFVDNTLIINTSLCGDWAGGAWESSQCSKKPDGTPRTCAEAVADPTLFTNAKWKINFIHVYQSGSGGGDSGSTPDSGDPSANSGEPDAQDPASADPAQSPPASVDSSAAIDPTQTDPGAPPNTGEVALATEPAPGASPSPPPEGQSSDATPPAAVTPR
ncbi:hypothetical protein VKT23_011763 [Stygiomarasmius scandens]|uniref:GH16 domain-containing protein n=1 Tax=Marasmiellus scandens TaxID=2682957 RepID=A0ABR1JAI8_9AGAR